MCCTSTYQSHQKSLKIYILAVGGLHDRSTGQARLDYILTKKADRRLIRCVNIRRPPLEALESDHNLVYAKVRIPRRSTPNQRKRDSTKETPKLADLRQLMTDPNLRCQVANAMMVDALPPIADGTSIGEIATDMADVMISTAAELVPRSKRPRVHRLAKAQSRRPLDFLSGHACQDGK